MDKGHVTLPQILEIPYKNKKTTYFCRKKAMYNQKAYEIMFLYIRNCTKHKTVGQSRA